MPGEERGESTSEPSAPGSQARLIGQRLRVTATAIPPVAELFSRQDMQRLLEGDAGHLQRAGDLAAVALPAQGRLLGRPVARLRRILWRLLKPLLDVQSGVNAANARVVSTLVQQLASQARHIEELERQLGELRAQRES